MEMSDDDDVGTLQGFLFSDLEGSRWQFILSRIPIERCKKTLHGKLLH